MDPILAMIYMYSGNYAPINFMVCFGQYLAISQYAALFSVLGTQFGGNGTSNFALPDMQGRVPVGYGRNVAQSCDYHVGESADNYAMLGLSPTNLPPHSHTANSVAAYHGNSSYVAQGDVGGNCDWTVPAVATTAGALAPSGTTVLAQGATTIGTSTKDTKMYVDNPSSTVQMPGGTGGVTGTASVMVVAPQVTVTNGMTGSGNAFSILPSYSTVNFILCSNGLYPSRP